MLLKDNFAHADLHAGNVIITLVKKNTHLFSPDTFTELSTQECEQLDSCTSQQEWTSRLLAYKKQDYTPKLILIDVGLISELKDASLTNFTDVVQAALQFDGYTIADLLISRSTHPHCVIHAEQGKKGMKALMQRIGLDEAGRLPISQIYSSNVMQHFTKFLREHRVHLSGDFISISIACLLIEGIGRKLDSDLDLMESISTYVKIE